MGAAPPWLDAPLPQLATAADLARWLQLGPGELDWFADPQGRQRKLEQHPLLLHYRHRWVLKANGSPRLLEMPKPRLKAIQRWVLDQILAAVPLHPAAHGFCPDRSCLTFAAPHTARAVVIRIDLADFFPSVRASRIHALFRVLGYPPEVSRLLTGLCTHSVPTGVLRSYPQRPRPPDLARFLRQPHLPQGAPCSPCLANLAAFGLDRRLSGLARTRGWVYTRYADDLAFSGNQIDRRQARFLPVLVDAIALEEGFSVNHHKTRVMTRSQRQHLTGITLNRIPNVSRREYDQLKAILHNCLHQGVATQTTEPLWLFRARLQGKVTHVTSINPARGAKLRAVFDAVDWLV